jgi:hypothetical protein
MYAICAKVDGELKYLNRFETDKYNNSALEPKMQVYEFGELCDHTLLADSEDWQYFVNHYLPEITKFMTEIEFKNFRAAFVKVRRIVSYDTMICNPFYINEVPDENGNSKFSVDGVRWDSFC